jgi:Tol biopolymer transport system component
MPPGLDTSPPAHVRARVTHGRDGPSTPVSRFVGLGHGSGRFPRERVEALERLSGGSLHSAEGSTLGLPGAIVALTRRAGSQPERVEGVMRWFALLTLIAVSAAGWTGSNAQVTDATRTIAFVRGSNLWVMRADGSEQQRLTRGPRWKASPVWSPDGRRIAYASPGRKEYGSRIVVVNADGSGELSLTGTHKKNKANYEYDQYHVWAPDGRRIVFERFDSDPNYAVYIIGSDGSGERRLTPRQGYGFARPDWSPDGRLIAFTHSQRGAVYVMRPNGTGRRVLATIPGARVWGVKWSPDRRLIAFIRDDRRREELWVMNADGTQPRQLVAARVGNRGRSSADFAWSPDSRQIAFTQCCRESELFVVNADGSGLRKLTGGVNPVWSPDGRAIAFASDRDGNTEIYVMNADGSDQRNISRSPLADVDPAWSPKS